MSLVNPHDIAWWYRWSNQAPTERSAPSVVHALPGNYETPAQLIAQRKPRLQLSLQQTADSGFGAVTYTGPGALSSWLPFMNLYVKLIAEVDRQIGAVVAALSSRPQLAANTVVVFTSDHGEYGASHGLRGKGAGVYEEAIHVPMFVHDLRGELNAAPATSRTGLTSSVDFAPLLLTVATGSNSWRKDPHYAHLAGRHDMARMLTDPTAPGARVVVHATDEIVSEFAIEPYAVNAPPHVVAIRTPTAKYAVYSYWKAGTNTVESAGQERELYDYSTRRRPAGAQQPRGAKQARARASPPSSRARSATSCASRCRRACAPRRTTATATTTPPRRRPRWSRPRSAASSRRASRRRRRPRSSAPSSPQSPR